MNEDQVVNPEQTDESQQSAPATEESTTDSVNPEGDSGHDESGKPVGPATIVEDEPAEQFPAENGTE